MEDAYTSNIAVALDDAQTEQPTAPAVPDGFYEDVIAYMQVGCTLLIFILAAGMLRLGASLWHAFSFKWRS